ncbi:MAG: type VI secretion system membrane subunit TssM [Pseudomonadota bacterium]
MKRCLKFLLKPAVLSLLGVLLLSLLVWFDGPLLAFDGNVPFGPAAARGYAILFLLLAWAAYFLWQYGVALLAERRLTASLAAQSPSQSPSAAAQGDAGARASHMAAQTSAHELVTLGRRMREALAVLRKAAAAKGPGGRYLYQLPWYVLVGAPGSGKTTALIHSGLTFPLAEAMGPGAIGGVGGTRHCDWWFGEEAVLLDTAGRYTTQDSDAEVDQAAWHGFLGLLRKHRRRRPINGAIVTVSVADLLEQGGAAREGLARAVRARVKELHERLGVTFPIYVVVTKCDLLAGFVEFFDTLGREERAQVWGMTFALDKGELPSPAPALAGFAEQFGALERRLQERVLSRVQQERDLQRRALVYRFPQQFAGIGPVLGAFLNDVFGPTRYEPAVMLRGVYFTSGTQEGSPIDRVMAALAGAFGLDRKVLPPNVHSGRSYFLTGLLRELIFKEAELAGTNWRVERLRRRLHWLGHGAIGVLLLALAAGLSISAARNARHVAQVAAATAVLAQHARALAQEAAPLPLLPLLDAARDVPGGYGARAEPVPLLSRFTLSQHETLGDGAQAMYQRLLRAALMPRLVARLEQALRRGDAASQEYLYATLRVYLMLGQRRHLDPPSVLAWLEQDWARNLTGASAAQRQALLGHAAALLQDGQDGATAPALDAQLIASTRLTLAKMPLPQRVYQRLVRALEQARLPEFSVNGAVGRDVSALLARHSGAPLTRGVPGMFSVAGHRRFQQALPAAIADIAQDGWVLDRQEAVGASADAGLPAALRQLYEEEYIAQWDAFLADVRVPPFSSLEQGARVAGALAAPDSPVRALLTTAARETTLDGAPAGAAPLHALGAAVQGRLDAARAKLAAALGTGDAAPAAAAPPGSAVDRHFAPLHQLVGAPGAPAPLDQVLAMLKESAQYFDAANHARRAGTPAPAGGLPARLKREAEGQPAPLGGMLRAIDSAADGLTLGSERARLNALWSASASFCQQAISGRYPLVRGAAKDITPDDFGKFFAPGGLMDDFFSKHLAPHVDMGGANWVWRDGAQLGIAQTVLAQFQRGARVRDAFFGAGASAPSLRFALTPLTVDPALTQVQLQIDGQAVAYSAGTAPVSVPVALPSGKGAGQVRFETVPALHEGLATDGPWAWLRMMDKAVLEPGAQGDRYKLTFDLDGHKAAYRLDANSVINPYRRDALERFQCPASL